MGFLEKILGKFLGNKSDKDIKYILPIVTKINSEFETLKTLSNNSLRKKTDELRADIQKYIADEQKQIDKLKAKVADEQTDILEKEELYNQIDKLEKTIDEKLKTKLDDILPVAFAIVKDTARRFFENEELKVSTSDYDRELAARRDDIRIEGETAIYSNQWIAGGTMKKWDMIHYDVQLIGGIVLHQGKISEMATGEGKTLVATLPVFLNALTGRGVHLVTVNDYLAKRDAEWMGTLFEFHGLRVDCIDKHQPNSNARRKAYAADITYGTNNEFGFDYLRDNMVRDPQELVQRRHNYAIVDEVDSVLIDDARTPLIISGQVEGGDRDQELFMHFKPYVVKLYEEQKKLVSKLLTDAKRLIESNDKKENEQGAIFLLRANKGLPKTRALIKYLSETGMKSLLHSTENTYLSENSKRMPEITEELFFVIDEKHNSVELTDKGHDLISGGAEDKNFFVLPNIGEEVARLQQEIADEDARAKRRDEVIADYAVKSDRIHAIHQLLKAFAMFERDVEYVVIENKVKIVDEQTGRIMEGRRYSDGLHQAIEAKENVKVEAASQTMATITLQNYFRMYSKLAGMTGTAETEAKEFWDIYKLDVVVIPTNRAITRKDKDDVVYRTKKEKYDAVIVAVNDLVKEGRSVLVGTTSVEVSELLSRMLKLRKIEHNVLNAKLHQKEADIVAKAGMPGVVTIATNMAGRGTDIKLHPDVKAAGGLAIIGTERHDSRRVDRQLRGRSGRQGDPGSSQFFVSLEDDLMRMFGSDRISKIMDRMGFKPGEDIQHPMISKSIERAQKKVEENNFGIRKRLLEYDDVMNAQREVVYKLRRHALHGERISVDLANMLYDTCEALVNTNFEGDFETYREELLRVLAIDTKMTEAEFLKLNSEKAVDALNAEVLNNYRRRRQQIVERAMPVIKDVFEKMGAQYRDIEVPITDGRLIYKIIVNLEKAYNSQAREVAVEFEKQLILSIIDRSWKEHLREMDDLKQSVQNAAYEQKDPLLIYKFESYELFRSMLDKNNKSIATTLLKSTIFVQEKTEIKQAQVKKLDVNKYKTQKDEYTRGGGGNPQQQQNQETPTEPQKIQPIRTEKKIGRNDNVKVRYMDGKIVEAKYKKVENDLETGAAVLIE